MPSISCGPDPCAASAPNVGCMICCTWAKLLLLLVPKTCTTVRTESILSKSSGCYEAPQQLRIEVILSYHPDGGRTRTPPKPDGFTRTVGTSYIARQTDGKANAKIVPPMLWIPHQLVGVPLYFNVTLECFTEAHPTSLNYWTREDGHMIHDSKKYRTESNVGMPVYKTHMRLHIFNIQQTDYGTYKCVAKNPRGETDGTIRLYTSTPPTTSPGPPTTESYSDVWQNRNGNDSAGGLHHHHGQQHPNSYSVHVFDRNSKYSSNLNDIDRSEQKSFDTKVIHWPPETTRNNQGATITIRNVLSIIVSTGMLFLAKVSLQ
uniref:Ig-like domain-containing protein n=1 Tax=Anopheles atroparvus TaxID=41427 RepID=A0A182J9A5_ANOAO